MFLSAWLGIKSRAVISHCCMLTRVARTPLASVARRLSTGNTSWPSVAIVGIGQLGAAVASNLLRNGVPLTLYDLEGDKNIPPPLQGLLGDAKWASSAKEAAAAADVVITALPRPEHVTAAFDGDDGILAGMRPGATWIEHSTTDFENTAKVRERVEAAGGRAVEAPLTGGMQILREGKMVTLVGADPAVFEGEIAALVALSAPRIVRCGEFGHATIIKIFSNVLCAVHDVAVGETLCIAKKAGLDMKVRRRQHQPPPTTTYHRVR
jgi:3-hydroxyisobutyrate dehydrogenase